MKKKTSIFLIILLCILVAVAGSGISYIFLAGAHDQEVQALEEQVNKLESDLTKARKKVKTTETDKETSTANDPTADWQIYTGAYEGITLKYPATWKFTSKPGNPADSEWPDSKAPFDGFTLTSPNNNFQIKYITHIGGLGGGCDVSVNCPRAYYYDIQPLTSSEYTNLQLIQLEDREQNNTTIRSRSINLWAPNLNTDTIPKTGQTIEGIFYPLYVDKGSDKALSQLSGTFIGQDKYLTLSTEQYFNLADVKEAIEILKTVKFSK